MDHHPPKHKYQHDTWIFKYSKIEKLFDVDNDIILNELDFLDERKKEGWKLVSIITYGNKNNCHVNIVCNTK